MPSSKRKAPVRSSAGPASATATEQEATLLEELAASAEEPAGKTWCMLSEDITVVRNWTQCCRLATHSVQVEAVDVEPTTVSKAERIQLFGSLKGPTGGADVYGTCLHAGGGISAMDFRPTADTTSGQYLALGVKPANESTHIVGRPTLWHLRDDGKVPNEEGATKSKKQKVERGVATMAMGILHHHGVVWDVKWCPTPEGWEVQQSGDLRLNVQSTASSSAGRGVRVPTLGLCAIALGNGTVEIVAIPEPSAIERLVRSGTIATHEWACPNSQCETCAARAATGTSGAAEGWPLGVKLQPLFVAELPKDVGYGNPIQIAWHPDFPHTKLLASFSHGVVAVWELGVLSPNSPSTLVDRRPPSTIIPVCTSPTFATWLSNDQDSHWKAIIVTASFKGNLQIWDIQDPFEPIHTISGYSECIVNSISSSMQVPLFVIGTDDNKMNMFYFKGDALEMGRGGLTTLSCKSTNSFKVKEPVIWGTDCMKNLPIAAYCGETGEVACFATSRKWSGSKSYHMRNPHHVVAAWTYDKIKPKACNASYHGDMFDGNQFIKKDADVPEHNGDWLQSVVADAQRVRFVKWSPFAKPKWAPGHLCWLASAGHAGIVYCQLMDPVRAVD